MKVTKIGSKYVYGVSFCFEDGKRKDFYYEGKHDLDEYLVFDGVRQDLSDKYHKFRQDTDDFEKLRDETRRQFDWQLSQELNAKMDEWTKVHPRPKPVNLAEIQETQPLITV